MDKPVSDTVIVLAVYLVISSIVFFTDKRELKSCTDKEKRYQALPIRFKLCCWLVIQPMIAIALASFFTDADHFYFMLFAIVIYVILENNVIKWYRKNGLF